jgi:hypothetical protein
MKHLILSLFIFISIISCSSNRDKEYEQILFSLEKNYTVTSNSNSSYLFCWKVSKETFKKDSVEYRNGLKKFYSQDINFLRFLIKNKSKWNYNWIKSENFCDSTYPDYKLNSNEYAVKVLIDNLILNIKKDTIVINNYLPKLQLNEIEEILMIEKDSEIKIMYKDYVKK